MADEPNGARDPQNTEKKVYDLAERTARFGEAIIAFVKRIPRNVVTNPLIGQLVRSATSVGANYCEADDAVSKKDFRHRISICKKEARESKYWLRMIAAAEESAKLDARVHWQEAKELHLIFASIWRKK
jgi:four helix bundle protein